MSDGSLDFMSIDLELGIKFKIFDRKIRCLNFTNLK